MEFLFSLAQYLPVAKFLWRAIFCFLSDLVNFLLKDFLLFIQNELFVQNTQKIRKQKFHPSSASLPNGQQLVFWLRIASSSFIKPYWAVVSKSIVLLGDIKLLEVEYQILSQEIKGSRLLKQQNQTMDNIIAKVGPQCRYHRRMEPKSGNLFTDQHQARRSELQRSDGAISRQLVSSRNVVYCHKSASSVERWVGLPYYILSQSLITNCHVEGESSVSMMKCLEWVLCSGTRNEFFRTPRLVIGWCPPRNSYFDPWARILLQSLSVEGKRNEVGVASPSVFTQWKEGL